MLRAIVSTGRLTCVSSVLCSLVRLCCMAASRVGSIASAAHAQHTAVTCCTCYICSKVVVLVLNSTIRQCSTCPARGCHDCVRRLREANVCSTCFSKISSWDEHHAHVAQQQFCQRTAQLPNRSSSSSSNSSTTPQPQQHNTSIESQQEHWEPAAAVLPTRESVNLYLDKLFAEKAAAKAAKAAAKKRARLTLVPPPAGKASKSIGQGFQG